MKFEWTKGESSIHWKNLFELTALTCSGQLLFVQFDDFLFRVFECKRDVPAKRIASASDDRDYGCDCCTWRRHWFSASMLAVEGSKLKFFLVSFCSFRLGFNKVFFAVTKWLPTNKNIKSRQTWTDRKKRVWKNLFVEIKSFTQKILRRDKK